MRRQRTCRAAAFAAVAAAALSTAAGAADAVPIYFASHYDCADGAALRVAYPLAYQAGHPIFVRDGQRKIVLWPARSGSGARYLDRAQRFEWWIRGNQGQLTDSRTSQMIFKHCITNSTTN